MEMLSIFRLSLHGRGLSRFWSNVEGYNGPTLLLISAILSNSSEADNRTTPNKWIIGVFTEQGLESRDTYFGSSAYLFAIDPIFRAFPPLGYLLFILVYFKCMHPHAPALKLPKDLTISLKF